jgi:N-acetylglutamate synthase-like GNAT family acetyltransferase
MVGAQMTDDLSATPLAPADLPAMRAVLRRAALPADDLEEPDVTLFAFARDGEVVGYGGLELYGDDALLRSIVVAPDRRREGVGRRIVALLLANAAGMGARRGYLLTTEAQKYFEGLGFAAVERRDAPPAIMATRQMAGLCPASAALMAKTLTP